MKKTENKTEEQQQQNVEKVNQDVVDKNLKIQDSDEDEEEEYEEMDIQHKLLIDEEGIDVSELPRDIIKAIRSFNIKLDRFEKVGTEKLFLELQQDDIAIADAIQNYLEDSDIEDDDDDEDDSYLSDNDDDDKNELPQNQQQVQQQVEEEVKVPVDIETLIVQNLKNNLISVQDLETILKREPDYPTEQVGKIKLRKVYLKPFYELV
jgi:hypothetical protein